MFQSDMQAVRRYGAIRLKKGSDGRYRGDTVADSAVLSYLTHGHASVDEKGLDDVLWAAGDIDLGVETEE